MRNVFRWSRRIVVASMCLLCVAWALAEASQRLLRWEAQRLLRDVKSIQVGHSTLAEAQSILGKGKGWGTVEQGCYGGNDSTCYFYVLIRSRLPQVLRGNPEDGANNWLPRIIDRLGLRDSAVGAQVNTEHGVVVARSYWEEVELPVRDWYLRGGAYVPSLAVSSEEVLRFREYEQQLVAPSHPLRVARRFKGPYGLNVIFLTGESEPERAKLMDFRFSCITQFVSCTNEREILLSGAQLLDENQ